ncbi:HpcH/HpaI aldolase/citrate lyase family protein [Rivibacter subsaxonicus]|uniref:HpcH/HpaI aldolase/citrate lyase family protein n=1 Tax=Rivibacter subsaxonicus TaxID=457575 RepID=UPI00102CE2A8|nr:aldolase/citrate lyase family protein [Rivibacter subsaxonicus]
MRNAVTPRQALFGSNEPRSALPVCDHYAGIEPRMRKALALQAEMGPRALFDVTLDLEDGAPVGGEHEHALLVAELLNGAANRFGRAGARVHPLAHARFVDDLRVLIGRAGERLAYLMVPKVTGLAELQSAVELIARTCTEFGIRRRIPVHALVETHGALRDVAPIAALPQIESLSFGLMDFVSAHAGAIPASAMNAQGQFAHPLVLRAKLEIAAACHGAGKVASHCVVTEFKDADAIAEAAGRAARELGYQRMWSIHPLQIRPIIEAFAPVAAEIDDAIEILSAAQAAHWAPIAHHGVLHDRASYRYWWHVLERAERTGQPLPAELRMAWFDMPQAVESKE